MEFKTRTRKVLTLSSSEENLLENTAILLTNLYEEDAFNQLFNQIANEIGGVGAYDFKDIADILHELANGEHIIEEIE